LDRVVIEGMLCGVPVIVARGGGNREVVIDSTTGLLYTPGDYHELAQKIRLLLENVQLARQIANNGRKWATEEFDGIHCSERVFTVLEEAIGRR
jgi:glycosyltransferase involved in cell wall biosynthesis